MNDIVLQTRSEKNNAGWEKHGTECGAEAQCPFGKAPPQSVAGLRMRREDLKEKYRVRDSGRDSLEEEEAEQTIKHYSFKKISNHE